MNIRKKRKIIAGIIVIISLVIFGAAAMGIIDYSKNYGYASKLIRAMDNNDFDKFNQLLDQNGNIDSKRALFSFAESNNMNQLQYACWLSKFDFVEPLLVNGATPNLDNGGTSILILCLANANKNTEEKMLNAMGLLIQYGANPNYKDEHGVSVLRRAEVHLNEVNKNQFSDEIKSEVIKLLVENGAK